MPAPIQLDSDTRVPGISCIDLFCGAGGLTHGLVKQGIKVIAGIDVDPSCKYPYEANNDAWFVENDIRDLTGRMLAEVYAPGTLRLLAGCAPCQPFSTYSQKGRSSRADDKWNLALEFGRLVKELQPELVTMENVSQFLNHSVYENFLELLTGYHLWYNVIECSKFGVPQTRKRMVLLGSRLGPIRLIDSGVERRISVRDVIGKLPSLCAGGTDPADPLHAACSLSELNLQRIKASKAGGTWRDWEPDLLAPCHRRKTGETYPSVYGRMEWDAPAPTITTQCFGFGNGRFGHPEQDRAISLREAAILQTFPEDYQFVRDSERVRFNIIGRLIGNAVPVRIGEVIGESLIRHVANAGLTAMPD
jgi:DNA (cytosine-5)-methyltransferase 1